MANGGPQISVQTQAPDKNAFLRSLISGGFQGLQNLQAGQQLQQLGQALPQGNALGQALQSGLITNPVLQQVIAQSLAQQFAPTTPVSPPSLSQTQAGIVQQLMSQGVSPQEALQQVQQPRIPTTGQTRVIRPIGGGQERVIGATDPIPQGFEQSPRAPSVQVFTGDVAKTTTAKLEQEIVGLDDTIATLDDIGANFEASFQTVAGRARAGGTAALEKIFNVPPAKTEDFLKAVGITKETDPEFLNRFTTFQTLAYDRLNKAIKEITGVAVKDSEVGRISRQTVDPKRDSPTQFETKRKEVLRIAEQMRKRRLIVLSRGLPVTRENLRRIPLNAVDRMFEREVGRPELTNRAAPFAGPPVPQQLNQANIDAVGSKFGF